MVKSTAFETMFFKKPCRPAGEVVNRSKIRRKKVLIVKSSRNQDTKDPTEDVVDCDDPQHSDNGDIDLVINVPDPDEDLVPEVTDKDDVLMEIGTPPVTLTDSECEFDKKKKNKPKHRKTMSMSNTIEMVRSMGDEWLEAAKREIGEHSKKKEMAKKKREDANQSDVVLVLSDATIGETDDFEVAVENIPPSKTTNKKKEAKLKDATPKIATSQIMSAQKMGVKMIAKASSVGALNFIRKKRPIPIIGGHDHVNVDEVTITTALFLDSERAHSDMVRPVVGKTDAVVGSDDDIFYDANDESEDETEAKANESKSKPRKTGLRTRKSFGGSLKRTGGRRKTRRRSAADDAPPLPPKTTLGSPPTLPKQTSHWLFGSSFKGGDGKNINEDGVGDGEFIREPLHPAENHHADRENLHSTRQKPVTRAESLRDKAAKVQRTKRKTSDPNQLISGNNNYHDAEASGNAGAASGGSSGSNTPIKSSDSTGQPDHNVHSDFSEEEEDNAEPWSSKAPAEILSTLSIKARKRQDLIHELVTTEASHVRSLRILRRIFATPLNESHLLSDKEFKALFPNLPEVLKRHRKLSSELKALSATGSIIHVKPLADVLIAMLGEPKYSPTLAQFCGGQRMALDALKERRRRTKELHAFLSKQEQKPLCARLRLQDYLACVWQRLTKYQLLLEGIIKTCKEEEVNDPENSEEEGISKLSQALDLAKDVLHKVNTAVKTTENQYRLKTIQAKLEIRGVGGTESDPGELKRLDLVKHSLIMEGTLTLRQDSTKHISVLALMLNEFLILLQKDNDKYIVGPIPTVHYQPLSPVIQWKTLIVRTNATTKNGFFLVNIAGGQMYDLKAANSSEYNMWIRNLNDITKGSSQQSDAADDVIPPPPTNPPPALPTNSDELPHDIIDPNIIDDVETQEANNNNNNNRDPEEIESPQLPAVNEDDGKQVSGAVRSIVPESVDDITNSKFTEDLVTPSSVSVISPPLALTAHRQITREETLRQAEIKVKLGMQEVVGAAKEIVKVKSPIYSAVKALTGGLEVQQEISSTQLLLCALERVNTISEILVRCLQTTSTDCSMARCSINANHGLCDACYTKHSKCIKRHDSNVTDNDETQAEAENKLTADSQDETGNKLDSIVMLEDVGESSTDPYENADVNLINATSAGLREIITVLIQRIPAEEQERELLRARLQQSDQRLHRLHHMHRDCVFHQEDGSQLEIVHEVPHSNSNDQSGEG